MLKSYEYVKDVSLKYSNRKQSTSNVNTYFPEFHLHTLKACSNGLFKNLITRNLKLEFYAV